MEKDISNADKIARKKQEKLRQTAAATKAQELSSLAKNSDGAGGGGDDSDDQSGSGVDGSEKSKGKAVEAMLADLTKRTPEEVFKQFDTDGSGLIDFDEFRAMLPQLGIKISMPKVNTRWRYLAMMCALQTGAVVLLDRVVNAEDVGTVASSPAYDIRLTYPHDKQCIMIILKKIDVAYVFHRRRSLLSMFSDLCLRLNTVIPTSLKRGQTTTTNRK